MASGCSCAISVDEYNGWECEITGGACMYMFPNSRACARDYGEGPDVGFEDEEQGIFERRNRHER